MSGRRFLERAWECALAGGDFLEEVGDDVAGGTAFDAGGVVEDEAVAEDGVGVAMDDNNKPLITPEMMAAVDKAKADIIAGTIKVHDYTADNTCPVQ